MGVATGVEVGKVIGVADDTAGGTVGAGVSIDVTVGNEASGGGSNVAVAVELPGSGEGEVAVVVGVAVGSAATSGGSPAGRGSSVAGTSVADGLISLPGRADSVGPAIVPVSAHAITTSNAITSTPIACPRTDGEPRFAPFFADLHMIRPSHGKLALKRGVTPSSLRSSEVSLRGVRRRGNQRTPRSDLTIQSLPNLLQFSSC